MSDEIAVSEIYLKETGKSLGDMLTIEEIMEEDSKEESGDDELSEDLTESDMNDGVEDNNSSDGEVSDKISQDDEVEEEDEIKLDLDSEVELEEEETTNFPNIEFKIVGTVIDVMDINNADPPASENDETTSEDKFTSVDIVGNGFERIDTFDSSFDNLGLYWHQMSMRCFHTVVPASIMTSYSEISGVHIVADMECRNFYCTGHSEYDSDTLAREYFRDLHRGLDIKLPYNYFPNDDTQLTPPLTWRGPGSLLFQNWLNYFVYQRTPYDVNEIK